MTNPHAAIVGPGFIILPVMWILCILLCILFSRCEGSAVHAGTACIFVAIIVTLVLWFYPRGEVTERTVVIYDDMYILRTAIVSLLGIALFIGIVVVAAFHCFDQQRAAAIKQWSY